MLSSTRYSVLSTREIIAESLRFYVNRFDALVFPFLIANLLKSILWKLALDLIPQFRIQPGFTENFLIQLINYLTFTIPIVIIFILISWIIDVLPNSLVTKYSSDKLEGRTPSLIGSLKTVTSNILSLLSVGFIKGLLVILGLALFIIPGIIMAIIFSLAIQVMIIERLGIFESLQKSRRLVAKRPWQVFSILLFLFLLTAIAGISGEIICSYITQSRGYVKLVITLIIISIIKPVQPVALTYLYYSLSIDQRAIKTHEPYRPLFPAPPQREEPQELIGYHPKFCFKCGQRLPPDAIYCPRCGVRVKT